MTSGKREGRGSDWGKMGGNGSWLGWDGDGWTINCYCMYCVGADQETAKGGARAPTCTLNLATLMRSQGEWYSILVQSPPFNLSHICSFACDSRPILAGAGLPELWGVRPGTRYRCAAVGLWSSDRGLAGTIYPCPAENTSHFPTSQANEPVDPDRPDRPPASRSSHLSASTK